MKIEKITINNFRSILKGEFYINDILCIVGANNSGKSAILKALNSYFNFEEEKQSFISGTHQYSVKSVAKIEITFNNLPLKSIYNSKLNKDKTLSLQAVYYSNGTKIKYNYKKGSKYIVTDDILIQEIKKDFQYVLIPLNRDHNQIVTSEKTILKQVIDAYLKIHTKKRDTLTPKVIDAKEYLIKNALTKVAGDIADKYLHNRNFEIEIDFTKIIDYKLLIDDLQISINEKGNIFPISECGSGIQSLMIIALYNYYSSLNNNNILFGIEEPETNLHPQSQKEFLNQITKGVLNSNNNQLIMTTHSPILIDKLDHLDVVVTNKIKDTKRGFRTELYQLPKDFWSKYGFEEFKYNTFYKYKNSDFFFSKLVIVVESKTDAEVFRELLNVSNIDLDDEGISFLTLDGIGNFIYAFYLLKEIKIKKLFILDKDFFFDYLTDNKENSRDTAGFFKYKKTFKQLDIINSLININLDRVNLEKLFHSNLSKASKILEKYDTICMSYNLEMDLIASSFARNELFKILNINPTNHTSQELLINNKNKIKKPEVLIPLVSKIPPRNLPNSYNKIRRLVKQKISELNK